MPIFVEDDFYDPIPPVPDMMLGDRIYAAITQGVSMDTVTTPSSYDDDDSSEVDLLGNPRTSNFDLFEAAYSQKATKAISDSISASKTIISPQNAQQTDSANQASPE